MSSFSPHDTTAASAAYALIGVHPVIAQDNVATMPPLPEDALTRQSIYNRLSLISARCELMLLERVDRMAVRGLLDDKDMKKFDQVTIFVCRLTSIRKTLDALITGSADILSASSADQPAPPSSISNRQSPGSAGALVRNPSPDQSTPPSPDNPQSAIHNPQSLECISISNLKFQISNPNEFISQPPYPISHTPYPMSLVVRAVPVCPALPIESIPETLSHIHAALTSPDSRLNHPPRPFIPKSFEEERQERIKFCTAWAAKRPDPKFTPTSFYNRPENPDSPYQFDTCPDCTHCQTPLCRRRNATPGFVTCHPNCLECAYTFECPWVPQKFRTDPG